MNPETILQKIIEEFQRQRPRGSLRAFSRESGVNLSTLSRILSGKTTLSFASASRILRNIRPSPELSNALAQLYFDGVVATESSSPSPSSSSPKANDFREISLAKHRLEWLDFAILDFCTLPNEEQSIDRLATRLGVSIDRILTAIERLEEAGLLVLRGDSRYVKSTRRFIIKADSADLTGVRRIHVGLAQRAMEIFSQTTESDVERRHVTSYTCAVDPARLPEARRRIERFQQELIAYLGEGEVKEIYGWSSFFLPLTVRKIRRPD